MLLRQVVSLLLVLHVTNTSFSLLTNIEQFKKGFLDFIRLRSPQSDLTENPRLPPAPHIQSSDFQETKFIVPTVQPAIPHLITTKQTPKEELTSSEESSSSSTKPVVFPEYEGSNQVLYRGETLDKKFHNKKIKIWKHFIFHFYFVKPSVGTSVYGPNAFWTLRFLFSSPDYNFFYLTSFLV